MKLCRFDKVEYCNINVMHFVQMWNLLVMLIEVDLWSDCYIQVNLIRMTQWDQGFFVHNILTYQLTCLACESNYACGTGNAKPNKLLNLIWLDC